MEMQSEKINQCEKIHDRVGSFFQINLKDQQLQAIHHLVHRRLDLILIAKTGFGKSIIFQAAPLIEEPFGICLILMPLKALQNEQCEKLKQIVSVKPFILNADSNSKINRKNIKDGMYTHGA